MKHYLLLIVFIFAGCKSEVEVMPQAKFRDMLMELHLAEALSQFVPKDSIMMDLKNEDSLKKYQTQILKKFNCSEKEFSEALNHYKQHPDILDSIYQQLLTDIAIQQARLR